jgi:WD40 repeat protein
LLLSLLALFPACSSEDKRPLLLVNAPLGTYAPLAQTLVVTVLVDKVQVFAQTLGASTNAFGNYGFYLPSGTSGSAVVWIQVVDINNCVIATGVGGPVPVSAGETSGPISVPFSVATVPCGADAGVGDTSGPPAVDGPSPGDVVGADAPAPSEAGPPVVDVPSIFPDVVRLDVQSPDVGPDVADVADAPGAPDVSDDGPGPDLPIVIDVGLDGSTDGAPSSPEATASPMSVLRNCTEYTHTLAESGGTPMNYGVYRVVFSPDGKNLVSCGEDGRAKVWDVTSSGLKENASKLVFSGRDTLKGVMRPDGKYLAIGDADAKVSIYDFPGSLDVGAAMLQWTLPATSFSPIPWFAIPRYFTSDGTHLVVAYQADSNGRDPNLLVVWDLTTQTIVRSVNYVYDEYPKAVLPGSYAGPMWVASALDNAGDAGTETIVSLTDIAQSGSTKAQVAIPGAIDQIAFTPDGNALVIGMTTGEVGLWDISDKTKIVKPASPLIPESSGYYTGVYWFAFTSDGSYLAVGAEGASSSVVKLVSMAQKQSIEKTVAYPAVSLAFAPGNLALAIGEMFHGKLLYCTP